jgi:hypothetical protein
MFGVSAFAEVPFATLAVQTILAALVGVQSSGEVGNVTETNSPTEDGVVATGSVGSVALGARTVALTGVQATGQLGTINYFYWSVIDDGQVPNWQNVNDSQTPNWQNVAMTV